MKDQYKGREDCLKREALTVCRFKGGLGMKEEGDVFEGGLIPRCTLCQCSPILLIPSM